MIYLDVVFQILLPLCVKIVVNFSISDGHHDNEDPEEHHADQELVHHPHWHNSGLQVFWAFFPNCDAAGQSVPIHFLGTIHLDGHASSVVHGFQSAPGYVFDVDFVHPISKAGQAGGVIRQVRNLVIVWVAAERLKNERVWVKNFNFQLLFCVQYDLFILG